MTRLADRILNSVRPPSGAKVDPRWLQSDRDLLSQSDVIVFDNVNDFYWAHLPEHKVGPLAISFPNLAPPFANFFLETRKPEYVGLPNTKEAWPTSEPRAWGILCWYQDLTKAEPPIYKPEDEIWARRLMSLSPRPRWLIELTLYLEHSKGDPVGPYLMCRFPIDDDGTPTDDQSLFMNNLVGGSRLSAKDQRRQVDELFLYVAPALLAISFLHCKNIEISVNEPPIPLSRKHAKHYGRPLIRYHVLNIRPMRTVLRKEGNIETEGLEKALHICRGHFKDYRKDGLFGKYKGIYWWSDQVRGHPRRGLVLKDYKINPPQKDA